MTSAVPTSLPEARALDAADPLASMRGRFQLPESEIYLDGNSLGALPRGAAGRVRHAVERQWGERLIRSWNEADWIGAPRRVGDKIARLIGGGAGEVVVTDSTSVNLFKLIVAAAPLANGRRRLVTEAGNFPTDLHVARGAAALLGLELEAVPRERVADAIDDDAALVVLSHVHYRTAERWPMATLNARARNAGTRILWDLSHSVGAVPLDLAGDGTELAVGCGYKYLNGGPGAPAFLYVAGDLLPALRSPIQGWLGHADPFAFGDAWQAAPGIERFQAGTPPILSLLALEAGVDLMLDVDMAALWEKAQALWALFADRVRLRCPTLRLLSPADAAARGSHISFSHSHAFSIIQALIARGVIGDYRAPNVARFGITPLYIGFEDVWHAAEIMAEVLAAEPWHDLRFTRTARVT